MAATTGAAKGSDARWIDLGTRLQIVDGAHGVPQEIKCDSVTDQRRLDAGLTVLTRGMTCERRIRVSGVGILETLALTYWIVGEHREAGTDKGRGKGEVARLPRGRVAWSHEDRWKALRLRFICRTGKVEQRRYGEVGLRLEEDLLDLEPIHLRASRDARIERSSLWHGTKQREDSPANQPLPIHSCLPRRDAGDRLPPSGCLSRCNVIEIGRELFSSGSSCIGRSRRASVIGRRGSRRLGGQVCGGNCAQDWKCESSGAKSSLKA